MPELPEVETMVRGLRPALTGADGSGGSRCSIRSWCRAARPRTCRGTAGARRSCGVGRRGKWVVVTLAGQPGNYRHPAADDGRLLAARARATRPHPPGVPPGQTRSDGLVLRHAAAGQDWLVRRVPSERREAFARSHGPGCTRDQPRRAGRRGSVGLARDQADVDGPEGARGDRQHLRRRDSARARGSIPSGRRQELSRATSWTGCTARSARFWPRRSRWRARASTPAIGRSWAWRAASWPRTPSTAARASLAAPARSRS